MISLINNVKSYLLGKRKREERKIWINNRMYILPDFPRINICVWYDVIYYQFTETEYTQACDCINSVIRVNVLSRLICEYVNDIYEIKMTVVGNFSVLPGAGNIIFRPKLDKNCNVYDVTEKNYLFKYYYDKDFDDVIIFDGDNAYIKQYGYDVNFELHKSITKQISDIITESNKKKYKT